MKILVITAVGVSLLAGAIFYLNRASQGAPVAAAEPEVAPVSTPAAEPASPAEPVPPAQESPKPPPPQAAPSRQAPARSTASPKAAVTAALLNQSVDILVSAQAPYGQKQGVWKELRESGKLDQAISELEQRMAANPNSAECAAALGQAYFNKCATLQDMREQAMLAMQADKLLDTAMALDGANWEARFTKAVGLSFWPPSMNKGPEVIQHFLTLVQQQEAQAPQPHFAESYVWLGEQYRKAGQGDNARAVWERGASLFPAHDGLKSKLATANTAPASTAASN